MNLVVFNDAESEVIGNCDLELKKRGNTATLDRMNAKIKALFDLAGAISQYSSIFYSSDWQGNVRTADTLIESLCERDEIDELINIPTKAVLGRGYLIAKINLFNLLLLISNPIPELRNESIFITKDIMDLVYTLLCEDVFISLIEDRNLSMHVRGRAAYLLANIWEYRVSHGVKEFAPILNSLWEARKNLCPVFGTMMGTFELMRLSENMDSSWIDFLQDENMSDDVMQSLEEFLFSLNFEELKFLREEMKKKNLKCVNKNDLFAITGKKQSYLEVNETDIREMVHFFKDRKQNAYYRKRAEVEGPKRTIEEYIMIYILQTSAWAGNL